MTTDDPLLAALADAAQRKQQADHEIRLLLAYAREHVQPRPYRLADLADAAGISVSGVRTAYRHADVGEAVAVAVGSHRQHLDLVIITLLALAEQATERHSTAA